MKVYIFMFGIANIVAGGPIYNRNKIKYLEERKWNVIVFPTDTGEIFIQGLEKYKSYVYRFLLDYPMEYTEKQRNELLERMVARMPNNADEIIVETGTDYTAYWGEMLAQRIGAKHFVMFLDEENERVTTQLLPFYKFKYDRHELACISEKAMRELFKKGSYHLGEMYALVACCNNSIEDYDSEICEQIKPADYTIGHIGRLDKSYVPALIDEFCLFAKKQPGKRIFICLFGGADNETIDRIKSTLDQVENLSYYITGYIFPIPRNAVEKCDVFVSAAGSATGTANLGLTTIKIDVYNAKPQGVYTDTIHFNVTKLENCNTTLDYLESILLKGNVPAIKISNSLYNWDFICHKFDQHMSFLNEVKLENEYFDFSTVPLTLKQKLKLLCRSMLGVKLYNKVVEMKRVHLSHARK